MAQYLVLIYEDEAAWANADEKAFQQVFEDHSAFAENTGAAVLGGNALQPTNTATSVRRDATGEPIVSDGAFAES